VPSLLALAEQHDIAAVYTQADRPAGRGLQLRATPLKTAALGASLDVVAPEKLDAATVKAVADLRPDALVVGSYGKILPAKLLEVPALAPLNIHPSLLPAYRGATPIQAALRDGLARTGVSIIWMTPEMDAGDVALAEPVAIEPSDDFETLHDRLAGVAAKLILEALARLSRGALLRTPQDAAAATFTKPLTKNDARIDFQDAQRGANLVRSLSPRPGAWTELAGKRVKVLQARAEDSGTGVPGTILSLEGEGPLIACARGALRLLRVIPEGKPAMSGAEFARSLKQPA
jgi:methionyl-tRNA formyltransferase